MGKGKGKSASTFDSKRSAREFTLSLDASVRSARQEHSSRHVLRQAPPPAPPSERRARVSMSFLQNLLSSRRVSQLQAERDMIIRSRGSLYGERLPVFSGTRPEPVPGYLFPAREKEEATLSSLCLSELSSLIPALADEDNAPLVREAFSLLPPELLSSLSALVSASHPSSTPAFLSLLSASPGIEHLSLVGPVPNSALPSLTPSLLPPPPGSSLSWENSDDAATLRGFPFIASLELASNELSLTPDLLPTLRSLPSLRNLSLRGTLSPRSDWPGLLELLREGLPNLHTLDVRGCGVPQVYRRALEEVREGLEVWIL
ncbi:hypothetical protein TeGR_g8969 [Tetraparma gracilis]|uniref:Uncharacterized protein n=1 Tax=Tetraparma gracilis TaxID=2962635 RepID=A0ABQ6NAN9_9STRA|nr:hypothetical protein TeGR_g8969 [Tetraparma gracilis]